MAASQNGEEDNKKSSSNTKETASVGDTLSFIFQSGFNAKVLFCLGVIGGIGNGLVYPALAFLFSTSFTDISAAAGGGDAMAQIRELAYYFMGVGAYALVMAACQTFFLECAAHHATRKFRLEWFQALLRQDTAFFDVHDIGGLASSVGPAAIKYQRGVGRKFGDCIQFFTTGVGGLAFGFYANWRVALVVCAFLPIVSLMAMQVVSLNQTRSARASGYYSRAASVSYTSVSAIRTVLALNAIPEMIRQYTQATQEAFDQAVKIVFREGLANGGMVGSFMLLYCILVLYGASLLYKDVEDTGCDPSGGVDGVETCNSSGAGVFGAMLGIMFAAQGVSQVGTCVSAFTEARSAAHSALMAIKRVPGTPEETVYKTEEEMEMDKPATSAKAITNGDEETGLSTSQSDAATDNSTRAELDRIKAILPKYEIDAFSEEGLKPDNIRGDLEFNDVHFAYPTRPKEPILQGFSVSVEAGKTIAFVGPSGSGKSSAVAMIERFYDPTKGRVLLDGMNIKDFNVAHLRGMIGYVGQEPTLFATTIAGNIRYGNPSATQEEIEAAAKQANAHDFIMSFPDGYETQVGDKGSQLSGGQKQRIAIARVLVGNPKMLLLDEATSALDSESELVVQDALDNVVSHRNVTTVVIAHRLSTIRNADIIAVVHKGKIVETGTHDELMAAETGYYRNLVEKQGGGGDKSGMSSSRTSSTTSLTEMDAPESETDVAVTEKGEIPHLNFKNVTFSYPTRPHKKIFENLNLEIKKGETVALVGPSGGGKSSTVALIERFYDPAQGSLEYMGTDVKSLNVHWYRDQIGYVGQEPTLFNETISKNIAYGAPEATQLEIEEAAKQANAHNFIMQFADGYNTSVGERGGQLSGGQKQRIAIARALVKKPKVLILDEATSALDSESESIVQAALDTIMASKEHTTLVIAHRLSTIANSDRIAFIADGKVLEYGTPAELLQKPHGRYKRLVDAQKRGATLESLLAKSKKDKEGGDDEEEEKEEQEKMKHQEEEDEEKAFNFKRAMRLASPDVSYILLGCVGAVMAGGVFPVWGILFAQTIDLLFRRVLPCDDDGLIPDGHESCEIYWSEFADSMQERSFEVGVLWAALLADCLIGFTIMYTGFGRASERLSQRVRNDAFTALIRQEVGFFDMRSVGSITSELQDDAARIHAFSGVPVRSALLALSSVFTGLVVSFVFMWPFALLGLACLPFMAFGSSIEMKTMLGEDQGTNDGNDDLNSPGGIVVETLLNMKTVSALTLEKQRFENYKNALLNSEKGYAKRSLMGGFVSGLSMFIQQWINGLQLWWGGYLLVNNPTTYVLEDFLVSNFALLFGMFGLASAFQDLGDTEEMKKSAGRIFYLLDRMSKIDPLSIYGKKLDGSKEYFESSSNKKYPALSEKMESSSSPSQGRILTLANNEVVEVADEIEC